jgi:hypothetical protein
MTTYEVQFRFNGRVYRELITTTDSIKARQLIRGRYPGAVITSVRKK